MKPRFPTTLQGLSRPLIGILLLAMGFLDLVESATVWSAGGGVQLGTQLLLLPAGFGVLRATRGWLRFARATVALTMAITVAVLMAGMLGPSGEVSLGAATGGGTSGWNLAAIAAALLAFEGWVFATLHGAVREAEGAR